MSDEQRRLAGLVLGGLGFLVAVSALSLVIRDDPAEGDSSGSAAAHTGDDPATDTSSPPVEAHDDSGTDDDGGASTTSSVPFDGWVDPASSGRPWGDSVDGLLTFRGNPTRSWHGRGPVPMDPVERWRFPVDGELTSGTPDRKEGLYFGAELSADERRELLEAIERRRDKSHGSTC